MNKIAENSIYIVVGAILMLVAEFKLVNLSEILVIIIGFVGFAALLNGVFGFYNLYKKSSNEH